MYHSNSLAINPQLLDKVDWWPIRARISANARFEYSKKKLLETRFKWNIEDILIDLNYQTKLEVTEEYLTSEMRQVFLKDHENLNPQEITKSLSKNLVLTKENIQFLYFCSLFSNGKFELLGLSDFNQQKQDHLLRKGIINKMKPILNSEGEVDFYLIPAVAVYVQKVEENKSRCRQILQSFISKEQNSQLLQQATFDIVDNKFFVPIRSDSYQSSIGRIVGHSNSGQTVYVEPKSVRQINAENEELHAKIIEEIFKFQREISEFVFEERNFYTILVNSIFYLDIQLAKISYAKKNKFAIPSIEKKRNIKISSLFHPLIDDPIANDVELKPGIEGIVISGPNTGGKSILLKSIALNFLFMLDGMRVPAKSASLFIPSSFYYFSSDEQSIEEGLSSFSSEAIQYVDAIENTDKDSLIFIDEVFNSTNSEDASHLAYGLIEQFTLNRSLFFISTHHKTLKLLCSTHENILSAHMGFDMVDLTPTYILYTGKPGDSFAFETFQRVLRESEAAQMILRTARSSMSQATLDYDDLNKKLIEQQSQIERESRNIKQKKKEMDSRFAAMELEIQEKKTRELETLDSRYQKIFLNVQNKIRALNQTKASQSRVLDSLSNVKKEIQREKDLLQPERENPRPKIEDPNTLSKGEILFCDQINSDVTFIEFDGRKKKVKVASGTISIWVSSDSLFHSNAKKSKKQQSTSFDDQSDDASTELDCRGMRYDEFVTIIDQALYWVASERIPFCNIIHGHGDGVLKNYLRKYLLKKKQYTWDSDPGNDGHTRVKLSNK